MAKAIRLRPTIQNGDWLLFRRRTGADPVAAAIGIGGRSPYYHAGMAAWINDRLFCVEVKQFVGGRVALVENLLVDPNVAIDVRHILTKKYDRQLAVNGMLGLTGKPYGWHALWRTILSKGVFFRWFIRPSTDDGSNGTAPYCSMGVSRESRKAGFDPASLLGDAWTEPGDLGRVPEVLAPCVGTLSVVKGKLVLRREVIE
jgi:hypothetical protein